MLEDMKKPELLVDAASPEIRSRTGLSAPDIFLYLKESDTKASVYFDAREFAIQCERLKTMGRSDIRVERLEPYLEEAEKITLEGTPQQRALVAILREKKIDALEVSANLPYGWARLLEQAGIALSIHDFAREQRYKTEDQLLMMKESQKVTEGAYDLVRKILGESLIDGDRLIYQGKILTSEWLKTQVQVYFMEKNYSNPHGMVIASGEQSARPHDDGNGPLLPNSPIIVDIFPVNNATGYYADMTRTYVKGKPSKRFEEIYQAVKEVQHIVADAIEVGWKACDVYTRTVEEFAKRGFETSSEKGFMHRTGHGLGLSVHEDPSLLKGWDDLLEPGMVVTVEPGLYYPGIGGARIEDVIVFHSDGRKENINTYEKELCIP